MWNWRWPDDSGEVDYKANYDDNREVDYNANYDDNGEVDYNANYDDSGDPGVHILHLWVEFGDTEESTWSICSSLLLRRII